MDKWMIIFYFLPIYFMIAESYKQGGWINIEADATSGIN